MKFETAKFMDYLIKGGIIAKDAMSMPDVVKLVETIISNPEEYKNAESYGVQVVLSEYENWKELNDCKK